MWRWLGEFWKACPWYALVMTGLSAAVSWITKTETALPPVAVPALAAGLYLAVRWELLGRGSFHVALLLTGVAALWAAGHAAPAFLGETAAAAYPFLRGEPALRGPEYPALVCAVTALSAAGMTALPILCEPECRTPVRVGQAWVCLFLLTVAAWQVLIGVVMIAMGGVVVGLLLFILLSVLPA